MAISIVQNSSNTATNVSSLSISGLSSSTSGNTLLVSFSNQNGTPITITSLIDNVGNVYTQISGSVSTLTGAGSAEIWIAPDCLSGTTTVTANFSGSVGRATMFFVELSGVDPISPVSSAAVLNDQSSTPLTPNLTTVAITNFLYAVPVSEQSAIVSIQSPWNTLSTSISTVDAYYVPGSVGSFQGIFNSGGTDSCSSGVVLQEMGPLTLMLSDSSTSTDSMTDAFSVPLSDSMSSSDSAPNSFSIQSDFIVPIHVPVVEQLVNQLVPANVKTYFQVEE